MRPCPRPYPPTHPIGMVGCCTCIDRRGGLNVGSNSNNCVNETKRMACSELQIVFMWVVGGAWCVVRGAWCVVGGAWCQRFPILGIDTQCLSSPPTVSVNVWNLSTHQPRYQ